ncbi:MAG TPA: histidine--tRNA ligase [Sedimentisphaerales bacterium]|nr:histidine--tRNA ligase [Sedimentisphaerales bacterium]
MKIPPVKGTRDFYPPDMAVHNYIVDGWKKASLRNGFEEYDGPIFEYLKMFQIKSGDEIVEQLFSLTDRGGRDLALRPEMTPTLARMVNQRINSLPRPIKWFSVPRLFRAERPQKGRLREFFQWNIDIIGTDDVLADAEIIFTTIDYLRQVGLTPDDIKVKMSSRRLLAAVLKKIGIAEANFDSMYALLDKRNKLPQETFKELLAEKVPDKQMADTINQFMELESVSNVERMFGHDELVEEAFNELAMVHRHLLENMKVGEYCKFDPSIVRGLAYYTGVVFEVHAEGSELRAICGGGRYDNLLKEFGGPEITGTGMGMGDCVLEILLREKGLLDRKVEGPDLDYFVACVPGITFDDQGGMVKSTVEDEVVRLTTSQLRTKGFRAAFSYKANAGLSKQFKEASAQNAKKCVIIGEEFKNKKLTIKDMDTGKQELVDYDEFLSWLDSAKGI